MSRAGPLRAGLVTAACFAGLGLAARADEVNPPAWSETAPLRADAVAPAAGGVGMLPALERAGLAGVARVQARTELDGRAYRAELVFEVPLQGEGVRGQRVLVAWEERSAARPPRFSEGDRLLLALEPLPPLSIWSRRIPDAAQRVQTWTPAERGGAFVRDPGPGAVKALEHFLALPPDLRVANPGAAHLGLLAATAEAPLAVSALERLAAFPDLDAVLDATTARRVAAALERDERAVTQAGLTLLATRRPEALRAPLAGRAAADASAPAPVYDGLAQLEGPLPAPLGRALLARDDSSAHRRVGARTADVSLADELPRRLRADPAAEVRIGALVRLVEIDGLAALDRVLFALGDPDADVRAAAAAEIGELGEAAVPSLRAVAEGGRREDALGAVGALRAAGAEGMRALAELADSHPDPAVRQAAAIATGRPLGHRH